MVKIQNKIGPLLSKIHGARMCNVRAGFDFGTSPHGLSAGRSQT
jgi:hypothetical protein